ncbi:hypothetical protein [Embleya sp. NPDC001921]
MSIAEFTAAPCARAGGARVGLVGPGAGGCDARADGLPHLTDHVTRTPRGASA